MRTTLILLVLASQYSLASDLKNDAYHLVKIGMPVSEAVSKLDGYASDRLAYDEPYGCYYLSPDKGKTGVHFMVLDEHISRFDIYDKEMNIQTAQSVGIGSTKKQVLSAYPNLKVLPHPYIAPDGEYLEVTLSNGYGIIFETDHDIVTSFRLGSYPAVSYIEGCL